MSVRLSFYRQSDCLSIDNLIVFLWTVSLSFYGLSHVFLWTVSCLSRVCLIVFLWTVSLSFYGLSHCLSMNCLIVFQWTVSLSFNIHHCVVMQTVVVLILSGIETSTSHYTVSVFMASTADSSGESILARYFFLVMCQRSIELKLCDFTNSVMLVVIGKWAADTYPHIYTVYIHLHIKIKLIGPLRELSILYSTSTRSYEELGCVSEQMPPWHISPN